VHLFWLSHEGKRPWLELSLEDGHGWTLSSMAGHGGAHRRGERGGRGEGEGVAVGGATGGCGRHGGGGC
jgi:hypothetical protein